MDSCVDAAMRGRGCRDTQLVTRHTGREGLKRDDGEGQRAPAGTMTYIKQVQLNVSGNRLLANAEGFFGVDGWIVWSVTPTE